MNKDEAVIEAAKHMGFYQTLASRAVRSGNLLRREAQDAVQDMYVAAAEAFRTYKPKLGKPTTYLTQPCLNVVRKIADARASERRIVAHAERQLVEDMKPRREEPELRPELVTSLKTLSLRQRTVLTRRARGETLKAIASDLGVSHQAISIAEQSGIRRLQGKATRPVRIEHVLGIAA